MITEIDVKATMKEKLDADFRKYCILGSCNPHLAHQALHAEISIGVLLPCNVIVYEKGADASVVATIDPEKQLGNVGRPDLAPVAREVKERMRRVVEAAARV